MIERGGKRSNAGFGIGGVKADPPILKLAKPSAPPERCARPGYETLARLRRSGRGTSRTFELNGMKTAHRSWSAPRLSSPAAASSSHHSTQGALGLR
jgi:hypothetical protein